MDFWNHAAIFLTGISGLLIAAIIDGRQKNTNFINAVKGDTGFYLACAIGILLFSIFAPHPIALMIMSGMGGLISARAYASAVKISGLKNENEELKKKIGQLPAAEIASSAKMIYGNSGSESVKTKSSVKAKPGEKIFFGFVLAGLLALLLMSWGVGNTFLSWDGKQVGVMWKVLSFIMAGIAVILFIRLQSKEKIRFGDMLLVLSFFGLAVSAGSGFKLTGGDIKQRVTFINLDGKVTNFDSLNLYYGEFYGFDSDTALVNYVKQYNELPGVNNWSYNIREGITPKSTAPRADEDFKWHIGAYEMDSKALKERKKKLGVK